MLTDLLLSSWKIVRALFVLGLISAITLTITDDYSLEMISFIEKVEKGEVDSLEEMPRANEHVLRAIKNYDPEEWTLQAAKLVEDEIPELSVQGDKVKLTVDGETRDIQALSQEEYDNAIKDIDGLEDFFDYEKLFQLEEEELDALLSDIN